MSRGNGQWVVLRAGQRVVETCDTVPVTVNFPKPIYELLADVIPSAKAKDMNSLIRIVMLDYLEACYKKEHAK